MQKASEVLFDGYSLTEDRILAAEGILQCRTRTPQESIVHF